MRRSATRCLRRLDPRAFGARPLQMLHPQVTDTGQLTLITETKLTLILTLTLTDTVTLITQTKLTLTLALTLTDTVTLITQTKLTLILTRTLTDTVMVISQCKRSTYSSLFAINGSRKEEKSDMQLN